MHNVRFVGLDVHEESITIAVAESDGSSPVVFRRLGYFKFFFAHHIGNIRSRSCVIIIAP